MLLQSDFDNTMTNLQSSISALKGKREEQERNRYRQGMGSQLDAITKQGLIDKYNSMVNRDLQSLYAGTVVRSRDLGNADIGTIKKATLGGLI